MSPLEQYSRLYPDTQKNRLFQRISLRISMAPGVIAFHNSRGDKEKALESFRVYMEAHRALGVYFLTEMLSEPLMALNFIPVTRLGQWMSMEGIERWEGFYEKDGI